MQQRLRPLVTIAVMAACAVGTGCREDAAHHDDTGATPTSGELPPLELRDDTPDTLLTWVDDKGDFHVVTKPSEVPSGRREKVRVVVAGKEEGTGQLVYVANLSVKNADGTYPVSTMTRAAWDHIGADRRKARLEKLAPSAAPPSSAAPEQGSDGELVVIVYGADWCKPCHDAEDYLKRRGVKVVKKDIESDPLARKEMRDKLAKAGRPTASIPIIDVGGRILVGYSPSALDRALSAARESKTL